MFLVIDKFGFSEWLREEMEKRGFSQSELGRRAKLSRAIISKIINQESEPTPSTINSLAIGLKLPSTTVFRAAGIIPQEPEYVPLLDEWTEVFYDLSPEDREEILEIARLKARRTKVKTPDTKSSRLKKSPARSALKE